MFAPRYFAPRYFAPRYFANAGAASGGNPPDVITNRPLRRLMVAFGRLMCR